jgi:hypothetical protein
LSSKYYDPELNRIKSSERNRESLSPKTYKTDIDKQKRESKRSRIYPYEEDIVGPTLPTAEDLQLQKGIFFISHKSLKILPNIPYLEHLMEQAKEESETTRKTQKSLQKHHASELEELYPRADAGTHERRLENRAAVNAMHRSFRDKSPEITVPEETLFGGDETRAELERQRRAERTREGKREERMREREAERGRVRRELIEKEKGTMEMLKKLAMERFGGGEG